MILTGDIGGTNIVLTLWDAGASPTSFISQRTLPSTTLNALPAHVRTFLADQDAQVQCALFCLPGPIDGDYCYLANLGRTVDLSTLRRELAFLGRVTFTNDITCWAAGIACHETTNLLPLRKKQSTRLGTKVVIVPGTGLGGALIRDGAIHALEIGHMDFASTSELQWRLYRYLQKQFDHVSCERLLSGPGLANIYAFLSQRKATPLKIAEDALAKSDEDATRAVEIFFEILAAVAGNVALLTLAYGGVYLGGNILAPWTAKLESDRFLNIFAAKGRFQSLMEAIPLYQIGDVDAVSRGAFYLAQDR